MVLPVDPASALLFFTNLTAIRPYYEVEDESMVLNLLENSKAPNQPPEGETPIVYYRPYWVGGYFLTQVPRLQELSKAEDGVTFTGMVLPARMLFSIQRAKDLEMGLLVPPGMEADPCVFDRCKSSSGGESSSGSGRLLFGTQSITRRLVP